MIKIEAVNNPLLHLSSTIRGFRKLEDRGTRVMPVIRKIQVYKSIMTDQNQIHINQTTTNQINTLLQSNYLTFL